MTIATLWYSLLWIFMMLVGGAMYEQKIICKKRGKKFETLAWVGQIIIIIAMVGFLHGLLYIFDLITLEFPRI